VDVAALNELLRSNDIKPLTPAAPPRDLACGTVAAVFAAGPGKRAPLQAGGVRAENLR